MNDPQPEPQLDALFAQARARRPDTSVAEYAFETRLLARLRSERSPGSVWAAVSWRMVPFFTVCVIGLALWQSEILSDTHDAELAVYVDNSNSPDSLGEFNL